MRKIFITGANGYIGSSLCKNLAKNGYEITALVRSKDNIDSSWSSHINEVIIGDIRSESILQKIPKLSVDAAIHLISLDSRNSKKDPKYVSSINVLPTWDILHKLSKTGLKKFIYFSTIHVFGKLSKKISNNHKKNPISVYGMTHLLSENICNYFNNISNIDCTNIRLSNGYGPPVFNNSGCWDLVINNFCLSAYKEKKIVISSDGTPLRDFIFIDDISNAVECVLNSNEKIININVASGKSFTIKDLALRVKNIFDKRYDKNIEVLFSKKKFNPKKIDNFNVDISKLNDIGFKSEFGLSKGINEIFNYLEKVN